MVETTRTQADDRARRETAVAAAALAAAVLVALGLRAWALYVRGVLDYDETYYYILGRNLFSGDGYTLNGLPHTAFPPLYPILAGFAGLFTSNMRLATSLVSALAGALLPVPMYFLARDLGGRRAGALAAWMAAVWPAFVFYGGMSVRYSLRMYAGSEPLFLTLFVTGALFAWLAARRERALHAALAGAALGLATLTRNEGLALFACAAAWFAADRLLLSRLRRRTRAGHVVAMLAAFLLTVGPYVFYVHSVSGRWDMGAKLSNLVRTRATLWDWMRTDRGRDYSRVHTALNADSTEMYDEYWGVSEWHRTRPDVTSGAALDLLLHPDWRWLGRFAGAFVRPPMALVPWFARPLILLGMAVLLLRVERLRYLGLVAATAFALAAQAVMVYTLRRFQLPLAALAVPMAALGLDASARLVRLLAGVSKKGRRLQPLSYAALPATVFAFMAYVTVVTNLWATEPVSVFGRRGQGSLAEDARLAATLAETVPQGATFMCHKPWVAVLAGLDWRVMPAAEPERVVKYAAAKGIDFALIQKRPALDAADSPLAPYFARECRTRGGALCLYDFRRPGAEGGASRP